MGRLIQPFDTWCFEGTKAMNALLAATAISDQSSSYPSDDRYGNAGVVRLTLSTTHGFTVGDTKKKQNLILVKGSTGYDGVAPIIANPAGTTLDIVHAYTAETPAGTEIVAAGIKFDHMVELLGFTVGFSAEDTTSQSMVLNLDADRGSAFDETLYSSDTNGESSISFYYADDILLSGRPLEENDVVYFTWANANNLTWGAKIFTRRLV